MINKKDHEKPKFGNQSMNYENVSVAMRKKGNEFFQNKNYFDALTCYNSSFVLSLPESEERGLTYANRAMVYLELELYDLSLENLKLARENKYPKNKSSKFAEREKKCKEEKKSQQMDPVKEYEKSVQDFFKLSHKPNTKIPFLADCIELKKDKKFGSKIISNKPLVVGDIIAIEKPFCGSVQMDSRFQRCATCFKQNFLNLLPCSQCRSVMFCSYA